MPKPLYNSSASTSWTTSTDPVSFSFTVPSSLTNPALVVAVLPMDNQNGNALSPTVKWGGSGGTSVPQRIAIEKTAPSRTFGAAFFVLTNPTAQTADVHIDFGDSPVGGVAWAAVYEHVDQTSPAGGTGNTPDNLNASSAVASMTALYTSQSVALAGFTIRDGNNTHTLSGHTSQRLNLSSGSDATTDCVGVIAEETITAAGTVEITDSWGASEYGAWAMLELLGTPHAATASITQAGDTVAATAEVTSSAASAVLAITQSDNTASATAKNYLQAVVSKTAEGDTVAATATVKLVATASVTQDDNTINASAYGIVYSSAEVDITQASNTIVATAVAPFEAAVDVTQEGDSVSSAAVVALVATASITQEGDSTAATSVVALKAALSGTQEGDSTTAAAAVKLVATLNSTQADNSIATAVTSPRNAVVDLTQASDTAEAASTVLLQAAVDISQDDNTIVATVAAGSLNVAVLSVAQDDNTVAATAQVAISAALDVSQASDTVNLTALAIAKAELSATQDDNTIVSAFQGTFFADLFAQQDGNTVTSTATVKITSVVGISQAGDTTSGTFGVVAKATATIQQQNNSVEGRILFVSDVYRSPGLTLGDNFMAIYKNRAGQGIAVYAYNRLTNDPVTEDAANITAYISKDGDTPAQSDDVNPTEIDDDVLRGWYWFDLTQAETNAEMIIFSPRSTTLNVMVDQLRILTEPLGKGDVPVAGAVTFTYELEDDTNQPIEGADVWVTSDLAGTNIIASGVTDEDGLVTFYLDTGTVYVWRQLGGWDFTNPDQFTIA